VIQYLESTEATARSYLAHGTWQATPVLPARKSFPHRKLSLQTISMPLISLPCEVSCYPCLWQSSNLSLLYSGIQSSWFSLRSTTNFSWACSPPWDLSFLDMISESLLKCTSPNIPRSLFCTDHSAALHPNPSLNSSTIQPALKRKQLPQNQ